MLTPDDFDFLERESNDDRLVTCEPGRSRGRGRSKTHSEELRDPRPLPRESWSRWSDRCSSAVLAHTQGNQIRAAAILGINRNTLRKKITELALIALPGRNEP